MLEEHQKCCFKEDMKKDSSIRHEERNKGESAKECN